MVIPYEVLMEAYDLALTVFEAYDSNEYPEYFQSDIYEFIENGNVEKLRIYLELRKFNKGGD